MADDEPKRFARILQKGFGGLKRAYQHPVTQKIGSGAKTTAAAGAGLMGGLAIGASRGGKWIHEKTSGIFILIFPILLWLFDAFVASFEGLTFSIDSINLETVTGFLTNGIFLIFAVVYFFIRRPSREEMPYFIAVTLLLSYIALFIGYHPWVLVHFVFAVFVYGYFLKGFDRTEPITGAHWLFLIIVIWDMFDFPLFQWLNINSVNSIALDVITNQLLFPIWIFYFFIFMKDSGWKTFALISILIFYIAYLGFQIPDIAARLNAISPEERAEAFGAPQKAAQNLLDTFTKWLTGQVQFAITGKVEQNQYEPLGVYLEDVRSAQTRFYTDEEIVVWGTVKARTLDDQVSIKMGCFVKEGDTRKQADKVNPERKFNVFTLEEQDFACSFDKNSFSSGSKTITTFAQFNFETLSFVKTYFMDRERLRAMTRENLDPFEEFGITDKNPVAIYTNGPVELAMETTTPLIGVSTSYLALPRFNLVIKNRQGWEGKIKELRELVLLLPKGVEISNPATDCNERFLPYDVGTCTTQSCQEFVNNDCISVCKGFGDDAENKQRCENSCREKEEQCQNNCRFLFEEEGQQYKGYYLDVESLKSRIKEEDDWERFTSFSCSINPKPQEVLENTPITTKSFRAKARYNYTVEKPVTVKIERIPGLKETEQDALGGRAVTGSTEIEKRIIEIANGRNFGNPSVVLAVAKIESSFKHCRDGILNCGTSNQGGVNCNTFGSCGIMQINKNAHPDLFTPNTIRLNNFGCNSGETAYDIDCNIKSGIGILQQNYNAWGQDTTAYNAAVDKNCLATNNPNLNKKYKAYTDPWDRAVRAYNGFGCTAGADTNYVEKVKDARTQYITTS